MFYGTFDSSVDEKGRLNIPEPLKGELDKNVLLVMGKYDCVEIHTMAHGFLEKTSDPSIMFGVRVRKVKKNRRITIPRPLRDSDSFYFGNKVTLVGKGSFIRLLPRPH
jgi:DNA-binding transcriptional regulator/RsmH inhibitor MraZ